MSDNQPGQVNEWRKFSTELEKHLTEYVIPQYGDSGNDPATEYDFSDCVKQAKRYLARADSNQRPEGLPRDMLKAAHWIQKAFDRLGVDNNEVRDKRIVFGAFCTFWGTIYEARSAMSSIGVPSCPHCGGVLYEDKDIEAWNARLDATEVNYPDYVAAMNWQRESKIGCSKSFTALRSMYRAYLAN